MNISPVPVTTTTTASAADRNPWGFPPLDATVARAAIDGLKAGVTIVNRLIDRSIAVRTMLDRDIKAGSFGSDTVRAVQLLTRARDHALGTLNDRHLSDAVLDPIHAWAKAGKDERVRVVGNEAYAIQSAVLNLLDDDEGNVRDSIASMRTNPGRSSWQAVRDSVDGAIASLYGSRDVYSSLHVLRAAGNLG